MCNHKGRVRGLLIMPFIFHGLDRFLDGNTFGPSLSLVSRNVVASSESDCSLKLAHAILNHANMVTNSSANLFDSTL